MHPISATTASDLIAQVYDCVLDPDRWPSALSALHQTLGFANASMALNAIPTGVVALETTVGVPDPYRQQMVGFGPEIMDLWGGIEFAASLPLDVPAVLSRLQPWDTIAANRYYREWAEPQGLIDVVAIGLARDAKMIASLGMGRHRDAGEILDVDLANVQIFVPHLQRAVAISRLFELKAVKITAFHDALDSLAAPAFIVSQESELLHSNQAGTVVLRERDPLLIERGVLRTARQEAAEPLRMAVAQAVSDAAEVRDHGMGLPLRHRNGDLSALHILSGRRVPDDRIGHGLAILFLSASTRRTRINRSVAADAYKLTAAEAQVFDLVAQGITVEEIARDLGVGRSTVRTHLIHLFDKTGTHRQADLVHLAARLAAP